LALLILGNADDTLQFFKGSRDGTVVRATPEQNPFQGTDAQGLGIKDVHELTWRCGDDESWHKFEAAADEATIEGMVRQGGARRCPSSTCSYVFVADAGTRHFDCPSCAAAFCLACPCVGGGVGPAHPGISCAEYEAKLEADAEVKRKLEEWRAENEKADERFRELLRVEMRNGDTKPCPCCKQAITKNGGCHHHTCTSCKVCFCWNCGRYDKLFPNKATCPTTCARPSQKWWAEHELLGHSSRPADSAGASSSAGPAGPSVAAAAALLPDGLRARLMAISAGMRGQ